MVFSKYLGETEVNIRMAFEDARRNPPTVILMDEIDYFGLKRSFGDHAEAGNVQERILTTLLTEMDGVHDNRGVMVVGCTIRPDRLDPALLRQGRLDCKVFVRRPTIQERREILRHYFEGFEVDEKFVTMQSSILDQCEGWTGSDLEALARNVKLGVLRRDSLDPNTKLTVQWEDIEKEFNKLQAVVERRIAADMPLEKQGFRQDRAFAECSYLFQSNRLTHVRFV